MQEHLPHCKLFFPKSSALMVMVTPRSLQLAQPPPVPYLGVISCYRQKAIHLRVCRPASTYASTSMCTHIYTGAHTHAHTYMPLVHFTRSSGKPGKLYLDSSSVCFAVNRWAGQPDAITFLERYKWNVWTILGVFPQAHEALKTLLTTWWREICFTLGKSDIWGIFLVQPCQLSSIQNSIDLKVIFPLPFSYSLRGFLSVNDARFTISCKSRRKPC